MFPHHLFAIALLAALALIVNWQLEVVFHNRRIQSKPFRIHVNGIRGKSTVTRIVAGILRAAKLKTIAKTTGSAACTIDDSGNDHPIIRNGSPTILEQVEIIRGIDDDVQALVIECMAIKPDYQQICETKIVQSNIGIITNVREDHQDVLGETLHEIARNLLNTCPTNGVLITAEQNPRLLPIFRKITEQKHTQLIIADPLSVSDEELLAFDYVAFKDNIAVGFALANLLGVDRKTALHGMTNAAADPGSLTIARFEHSSRSVTWADMFAVNDRESVIAAVDRVEKLANPKATKFALLNNRSDREYRALQFAQICANDLHLDYVGLLGAYENQVYHELIGNGFPANRIIRLGEHRGQMSEELIDSILSPISSDEILLMGMVNIHTAQAESLRHWITDRKSGSSTEMDNINES